MGKQRVEHPTMYKSRMAADRMSVLLVIDREILAPYTKAAKEARIDRNSILVSALAQASAEKKTFDGAIAMAREHNGNTRRSLATKVRRAVSTTTTLASASTQAQRKVARVKTAAAKAVKPSKSAKPAKPAKAAKKAAAPKKKAAAKKAAKSMLKSVKVTAKAAAKPASAPAKLAKAAKSISKRPSVTSSASKDGKAGKPLAGKPARAEGKHAKDNITAFVDDGSKSINMPAAALTPASLVPPRTPADDITTIGSTTTTEQL